MERFGECQTRIAYQHMWVTGLQISDSELDKPLPPPQSLQTSAQTLNPQAEPNNLNKPEKVQACRWYCKNL